MRIPFTIRLRFPGQGSSSQGESGPKTRPKGVADGHQVDIPVLDVLSDAVTKVANFTSDRKCWAKRSSRRIVKYVLH